MTHDASYYTRGMCLPPISVDCFGLVVSTCPHTLPFGHICFVVPVMRKGGRAVEVVPGIYAVH